MMEGMYDQQQDSFIEAALQIEGEDKRMTPQVALMEMIRRATDRRLTLLTRIVVAGVMACVGSSLVTVLILLAILAKLR